MSADQVQYRQGSDELSVKDNNWLHLGQLRALVAKADELGWSDRSLVCHSPGDQHIYRHDVRAARRIVIEGGPA